MTIKELNNLKEQMGIVNEFNKKCLLKEYDKRHNYVNNVIAIEEYKNEINNSIQRLTIKIKELTGVDMEVLYDYMGLDKQDMYNLGKLDYLTATRLVDCYYNHFYKKLMLIINT